MTKAQFETITRDLEAFYEKSLNPTQKSIWFEELEPYNAESYSQAIRNICKISQYRPTIVAIVEAIRRLKKTEKPKERVECKACKGTGITQYHKVINGIDYEYAAQCNCPNAIGLEYDGSIIADKEHRSDYYLAKAADVFGVSK